MPEKDKNRLYITLQYRIEAPGFHWALVLAPKSESSNIGVRDSHLFHVINTIQPGNPVGPSGKPDWRYETKLVNSLRSRNLIARVLVAKLPSSTPLKTWTMIIHETALNVPIVQNDPNWTCRVWVENVLAALRVMGGNFGTIPHVANGGEIEGYIKAFGEQAKDTIFKGTVSITSASDLPILDIRGR